MIVNLYMIEVHMLLFIITSSHQVINGKKNKIYSTIKSI